jgi:hypothetical protein
LPATTLKQNRPFVSLEQEAYLSTRERFVGYSDLSLFFHRGLHCLVAIVAIEWEGYCAIH